MYRTEAAPFWQTRPLAALAVGFGIGARIGLEANLAWGWGWIPCLAVLLGAGFFCLRKRFYWGLWIAVCLAALIWGSVYAHPDRPPEGNYSIAMTIDGDVRLREDGQVSAYVKDVTLNGEKAGRAYWSCYLKKGERPWKMDDGDRVTFTGSVYHPDGRVNPYGFDFEEFLLIKGSTFGLYGRDNLQVERRSPLTAYHLRKTLGEALEQVMPGSSGLARALLLGDRSGMEEDDRAAFQELGVAHVLAVSGLHVSFIFGFLLLILGRCGLRLRSFLTVTLVIFYAWLTGFSPSIARALILCLMTVGARLVWRAADPLTNLALAFMALIALNPMNLLNAGFIMSFSAVLGILLVKDPIARWLGFLPEWLRQALAVSLAAHLGVAVPVMACYQQLPLAGIALNLLVIPATGLLMGFYAVTLLLSWTPLGAPVGQGVSWLTQMYLNAMGVCRQLPLAQIATGTPGWPVWIGALILLVSLSAYVILRRRVRLVWAAVGIALCCLGWPLREMPATYVQFSLGQADGAAVMRGNQTLLIDTGESAGDQADYLRAMNRQVDALFISHLHMDHAGGLEDLIKEEIPIGACYIAQGAKTADVEPQALELLERLAGKGVPVIELIPGEKLTFGGITVQVLDHGVASVSEANENSLPLLIELNGKRLLTAGDLPGKMENEIAVAADVLKVSHHGGAKSTGKAFLEKVRPKIALVSCESDGKLPNPQTLKRLEAAGTAVYRTDERGAITLTFEDGAIRVRTFLP